MTVTVTSWRMGSKGMTPRTTIWAKVRVPPAPLKVTGEDLLNIYVPPYKDKPDVNLYSVIEVQGRIRLTYRGTLKFIRDNITPIGGTVRVGNQLFVHVWALNYALEQRVWTTKKMRQRYQFTDQDRRRARG